MLILAAAEIGHALGERAARRGAVGVSTLEGAILGLLALMIGFTFSMALSRFEARRDAVLVEATVAAIVLLIQDIDHPGAGFIKVSQQPMVNAAAALAAFLD